MHLQKLTLPAGCVVLFLSASFGLHSVAAQTKPTDDKETIQMLLNEVRLLRRTLQRTGLNAYRGQIVLERIKAQNDQVLRLTRALAETRNEIEGIEGTIPRMTDQAKLMETMAEKELDANKRAQFEFESKERKADVERYKQRLERQRDAETQLSAQLAAEQNKLTELEGRLDALERGIDNEIQRQKTEDSPATDKKP